MNTKFNIGDIVFNVCPVIRYGDKRHWTIRGPLEMTSITINENSIEYVANGGLPLWVDSETFDNPEDAILCWIEKISDNSSNEKSSKFNMTRIKNALKSYWFGGKNV